MGNRRKTVRNNGFQLSPVIFFCNLSGKYQKKTNSERINMMQTKKKKPAVFLDRDGVIIEEKHYISKPEDVKLTYRAGEAVKMLSQNGFYTVVVSNQSGIARGYFTLEDYQNVTHRMVELLENEGAALDLILYSPFHPEGKVAEYTRDSDCRKPGSGMFLQADTELGIDMEKSFMIGDRTSDIEAGKKLGLFSILVKTGYGESSILPDKICNNLYEAAHFITGGKI